MGKGDGTGGGVKGVGDARDAQRGGEDWKSAPLCRSPQRGLVVGDCRRRRRGRRGSTRPPTTLPPAWTHRTGGRPRRNSEEHVWEESQSDHLCIFHYLNLFGASLFPPLPTLQNTLRREESKTYGSPFTGRSGMAWREGPRGGSLYGRGCTGGVGSDASAPVVDACVAFCSVWTPRRFDESDHGA